MNVYYPVKQTGVCHEDFRSGATNSECNAEGALKVAPSEQNSTGLHEKYQKLTLERKARTV